MFAPRQVKEVLASGLHPSGERFELVHCTDGTYGVRRDGELLMAFYWYDDEGDEAVSDFMRLTDYDSGRASVASMVL
jgi:hypothetical protein